MLSFKEYSEKYIIAEEVNAHMTHVGDLVFMQGVSGTRKAINFLRDIRDMLNNKSATGKTSTKIDGAPALFLGIDPEDNKFFVAKKGIFNKNPKLYKSIQEIEADLSGDLKDKFITAFTEFQKLGIKSGVYQGDLLYTKSDLKTETIDGVDYITFHPNTIVYTVEKDSELGATILKSNIGIAFHTKYTGDTIQSLSATFGERIAEKFAKNSTYWAIDAVYQDDTGKANFTTAESKQCDALLSELGRVFQKLPATQLNWISTNQDVLDLVMIYINSLVRANKKLGSEQKVSGFRQFVTDRMSKELESKKSPAGKLKVRQKFDQILSKLDQEDMGVLFRISDLIDEVKHLCISVMNRASRLKHFLKTEDGFKVTTPEGYVAINTDNEAVKLVDRYNFSMANFSPNFLKGWQR